MNVVEASQKFTKGKWKCQCYRRGRQGFEWACQLLKKECINNEIFHKKTLTYDLS